MKYRVAFGILAVLLFHLPSYTALPRLVQYVWNNYARYEDEVARYEQRFAGIKGQLPAHGRVGYRTDPLQQMNGTLYFVYVVYGATYRMEGKKSYLLTQYALAPVIVDRTQEYPLAVENHQYGVRVVPTEGE